MTSITCRYCSFYAPCIQTPIIGDCAGVFPPKRVEAINSECPFNGDQEEIDKQLSARGFYGHDLRRIEYYGVSELGSWTKSFRDLSKLIEFTTASGLDYSLYVCYIDIDNHIFARAHIPKAAITPAAPPRP